MGYIYLRTNKINGKKYVGLTTDLKTRQYKWNNLTQPYAGNVITNARAKYGIDAFNFEILKECKNEELNQWEMYYIKELNTKVPYGYNMTEGGDGCPGYIHSYETKRKISKGNKGKKLSDVTRKKLSECHRGEKHWFYGKHHSDETRKKMSEAHKGKTTWMKGKHHSEETKQKISECHRGEKHWFYGKHHSEETRKKMSDTKTNGKKSKSVLQINKDTNEIITEFPSINEVERQLGISHSNISQCCRGKRKTCCGFKWQYK